LSGRWVAAELEAGRRIRAVRSYRVRTPGCVHKVKADRRDDWQSASGDQAEIQPVIQGGAMTVLNARYRRAVKAAATFPSEHAALEYFYLVTRSLDLPVGVGHDR
jgi:hypothetical protein